MLNAPDNGDGLTSLYIHPAGLVFLNETLHLLWLGGWEEHVVEVGISLLLVDEFGQVVFRHVRLGFGVAKEGQWKRDKDSMHLGVPGKLQQTVRLVLLYLIASS